MIPEREREALMRLTMCAREECGMCKYKDTCDFDFQYETTTKCMNILADALRADRKTEPLTETCPKCKKFGNGCYIEIDSDCLDYEPKDEPSGYKKWEAKPPIEVPTEITTCVGVAVSMLEDEPRPCEECKHYLFTDIDGYYCEHETYGQPCHYEPKTEPQTEKHKCRRCLYYDIPSDYYPCSECVDYSNYTGEVEDEPQTDCAWGKDG